MKKNFIKLHNREWFLTRGCEIPGHVWKQPPFRFSPQDFAIHDERLNDKIFSSVVQEEGLSKFLDDPTKPVVYGVSSAPNDSIAKYFAAYLTQSFLSSVHSSRTAHWESLYGGFDNPAMNIKPDFLVINNLTPTSSNTRLEKARDLLEFHSDVPRVVIVSGEDPVTFFSTKLYYEVHRIFFHSAAIVRRKVEVI
jgi:hypothetical protein